MSTVISVVAAADVGDSNGLSIGLELVAGTGVGEAEVDIVVVGGCGGEEQGARRGKFGCGVMSCGCVLIPYPYEAVLLWFDGVVGYRICLTHRRSSVRAWVESLLFSHCFCCFSFVRN